MFALLLSVQTDVPVVRASHSDEACQLYTGCGASTSGDRLLPHEVKLPYCSLAVFEFED
jgi:hypothetical protein